MACVCVEGKGGYTYEHVCRLHGQVREHLAQSFLFACISQSEWPDWWAKVELFKPGRFFGRVLYLDLDVTVVGPLDDLVAFPHPFAICDDWLRPGKVYNSSVMVWDAGFGSHIYTGFTSLAMKRHRGDQDWITEQMGNRATTFPKAWCRSYKKDVKPRLDGSLPADCRVVVYHGRPKPWSLDAN